MATGGYSVQTIVGYVVWWGIADRGMSTMPHRAFMEHLEAVYHEMFAVKTQA